MITHDIRCQQNPTQPAWQQALSSAIRDPRELLDYLALNTATLPANYTAATDFSLRVPRGFVDRMQRGDWFDPLLRQVWPHTDELQRHPDFVADPLLETQQNPQPGLIHKYHGRVLLILRGGCAINCRYCFRRHFSYQENSQTNRHWQQNIAYIASDDSISEVIFSGGDPLLASDRQLASYVADIAAISHVRRLRIHSRLPIVIPQRITDTCLQSLTSSRLQAVFVVHCNHANELNDEVGRTLQSLQQAGMAVLNQAVLLAGVNDTAQALCDLSEALFSYGVLPYYLHQLDQVAGAAHFAVEQTQAQHLVRYMMDHLPGYLVPKWVSEIPGRSSKIPVDLGSE